MQGLGCGGVGSSDVGGEDGRSRGRLRAQSTSLKGNMGHLEACAAAAGLASVVVTALGAGLMATNAQLRRSMSNERGGSLLWWGLCAFGAREFL